MLLLKQRPQLSSHGSVSGDKLLYRQSCAAVAVRRGLRPAPLRAAMDVPAREFGPSPGGRNPDQTSGIGEMQTRSHAGRGRGRGRSVDGLAAVKGALGAAAGGGLQ